MPALVRPSLLTTDAIALLCAQPPTRCSRRPLRPRRPRRPRLHPKPTLGGDALTPIDMLADEPDGSDVEDANMDMDMEGDGGA